MFVSYLIIFVIIFIRCIVCLHMKASKKKNVSTTQTAGSFSIPKPMLWLILAAFIVYAPTLQLGFTDLDDTIFIRDMRSYTSDPSNLLTSFTRGVFHVTNDTYYRPMFLNAMILNYQLSGENIAGYHFFNILLHIGAVLLLFQLLLKLDIPKTHAFLLALLFAVHPVLTQAVTWIPGRNDTLMAIFVLAFFYQSLSYAAHVKKSSLIWVVLFLLLALFTKETALFAAPAAFILLVLAKSYRWNDRKLLILYTSWVVSIFVYLGVRASASLAHTQLAPVELMQDFISRLPLIIQYLGKIFFPFNLSVFPVMEDTVYYYGIAAILFIGVITYLARPIQNKRYWAGILFFLIFLVPILMVPRSMNEQTFEHRLYLPIIGILLMLPETILLKNNLAPSRLVLFFSLVAVVFAALNYRHQPHFKDAISFWEQAYKTSPHSAYAVMMYGARVSDKQHGFALMREAYRLNPDEKYLNYYYGVMLQEQDSIIESEPYLLKEKNGSGYYQCDFYLAKVAYYKKDLQGSINYLESYLKADPTHTIANNNLLLLYMETGQKQKAREQSKKMGSMGLSIPAVTRQQIERMPDTP